MLYVVKEAVSISQVRISALCQIIVSSCVLIFIEKECFVQMERLIEYNTKCFRSILLLGLKWTSLLLLKGKMWGQMWGQIIRVSDTNIWPVCPQKKQMVSLSWEQVGRDLFSSYWMERYRVAVFRLKWMNIGHFIHCNLNNIIIYSSRISAAVRG